MHDLHSNFNKFLDLTQSLLSDYLNKEGNVRFYPNPPYLPDSHIIAFSLCQEALGIDSETWFWQKLTSDYKNNFSKLIDRTRYNARRKNLSYYTNVLQKKLANRMNSGEDTFIIDSIPVPVCKPARGKRLKICKERFETSPDNGYSSVHQQNYTGYKLHVIASASGVMQSKDLTRASVHDIKYLEDVKYSGLNNCILLGDKGYLGVKQQLDLFTSANIQLQTPQRSNQKGFKIYPSILKRFRLRIETIFSQLCDQMMLKRNYAKSFRGLSARIAAKVAAFTTLQYLNYLNNRPINKVKTALKC